MGENYITCKDEKGSINISEDVLVSMVRAAVNEIDVIIMVRYGSNVVSVAKQVQDTVTGAVESMTGMGAPVVNVHVSGVAFDK